MDHRSADPPTPRATALSRRTALALGGSLTGAALLGRTAAAQEATPAAVPSVLVAWTDAWDTLDPDAVAALYTEDGVFEDVASGIVARGRAEIAAALGQVMAGITTSQNDPVGGFGAGDMAVMEYQVTAVNAASGQEFSFRGALVAELAGELIRHSREYYDVATILGQLGLLGGGTPEAGTPAP